MKILISTPFFNNLGGTELETIHTANAIAENDIVKKIVVFIANDCNYSFLDGIKIHHKIIFKTYPKWFNQKSILKIQKRISKIFKLRSLPLQFLYWRLFLLTKYTALYIITKSTQNYFFPIAHNFKNKNKIFYKFTTILFEDMLFENKVCLRQSKACIVTSKKQLDFFKSVLNIKNVIIQDVIIFNENLALAQNKIKSNYDFGILARFSDEKQLEDAIDMILSLKKIGINATLIIKGKGDFDYYKRLLKKVKDNNINENITLDFNEVKYNEVFEFYKQFNCFLITSKYEGGPNTALEIMALGMPLLSYKVGAMQDRLINFPNLIVENKTELVQKAKSILELSDLDYNIMCQNIKREYKQKLSNKLKIDYLKNVFIESKTVNKC